MGALDTFPGLGSPAPAPAPVKARNETKGLPGWAIALIVAAIVLFLAIGVFVTTRPSARYIGN